MSTIGKPESVENMKLTWKCHFQMRVSLISKRLLASFRSSKWRKHDSQTQTEVQETVSLCAYIPGWTKI